MSFIKTKYEANEKRRGYKQLGKCSCYTKLRYDGGYCVSVCPIKFDCCIKKMKAEE